MKYLSLTIISTLVAYVSTDSSNDADVKKLEKLVLKYANGSTLDVNLTGPQATTFCHSVGGNGLASLHADVSTGASVECYAQWGCGGDKIAEFSDSHSVSSAQIVGSCKLKGGAAADGGASGGGSIYGSGSGYNGTTSNTTGGKGAPETENSQKSAILYEGANYSGIKHWIDGTIGECRGLSGVPVGSVQAVASAGSDVAGEDDFTLAFFDGFGCTGNLVGGVTGAQWDVKGMIEDCKNTAGCPKKMGEGHGDHKGMPMGGDNTTAYQRGNGTSYGSSKGANSIQGVLGANSVRFVKTGIDNKFYSMSYDGKSGSTSSATALQHSVFYLFAAFAALLYV